MPAIEVAALKVKVFADGADLAGIKEMAANPLIKGFTTNPTLMRKAGIADYKAFALQVLQAITDRPVSFEVFADDFGEMEAQAFEIASWGKNVNVKIPVTNTKGEFSGTVIERLSRAGVQVNVTALLTLDQVKRVTERLAPATPAIISVFAGRIADTGRDPIPLMKEALGMCRAADKRIELLWASPRELLNIVQAAALVAAHPIIAVDLFDNRLLGKDADTTGAAVYAADEVCVSERILLVCRCERSLNGLKDDLFRQVLLRCEQRDCSQEVILWCCCRQGGHGSENHGGDFWPGAD
jgi:transaldolase